MNEITCSCGRKLKMYGSIAETHCPECDKRKCDVCGKESHLVIAGRWVFYCSDNPQCKQKDIDKTYDNELKPSLIDGQMPDCEVLEMFI